MPVLGAHEQVDRADVRERPSPCGRACSSPVDRRRAGSPARRPASRGTTGRGCAAPRPPPARPSSSRRRSGTPRGRRDDGGAARAAHDDAHPIVAVERDASASSTTAGASCGATAFCSLPIRPNALGTPGCSEKSSISSLSTMPVLPATRCAPKPRFTVVVSETALPVGVDHRRGASCRRPWAAPARGPSVPYASLGSTAPGLIRRASSAWYAGLGQVRHVDGDEVGVAQEARAIGEARA